MIVIHEHDYIKLLSEAMKRARDNYKYSQQDVASIAKTSLKTIQNMEECNTDPQLGNVGRVCAALDLDPRTFICPDRITEESHIAELHQLVMDCTPREAAILSKAIIAIKEAMRQDIAETTDYILSDK